MALCGGKRAFVHATAAVDKAGRIVVPKKMRDALHLVPGTRLTVRINGGGLIVEAKAKPKVFF